MNAATAPRRSLLHTLTGGVETIRTTHPVTVLRWLRTGVLATVVVTALLYLLVSAEADHRIAAARRTERALLDIRNAHDAAVAADKALTAAFGTGQVALIGTGADFANATARVNTDVTSAAQGNAAGKQGLTQMQFVQGQLTTCVQLADAAVRDYRGGQGSASDAHHALTDPDLRQGSDRTSQAVPDTGGLTAALSDLQDLEQSALVRQRHSHWLEPAYVWSLLVGPVIAMLLLVFASAYVVARHFRRHVGPRLGVALLATAAVGVTAGVLSGNDARRLSPNPQAGHPVTLTLALSLLAAAGVLAYLAYRPRLAEYRFPRS